MVKRKMQDARRVRVRIAPSPTGFAHVGTAYMALFNYAFAKKHGGKFVLRIEDTDVKRNVEGAEEAIFGSLDWLGLSWDEGPDKGGSYAPYRSSERLDVYKRYAGRLLKEGLAFKGGGAVSLCSPGEDISWEDMVRGEISFPGQEVGDFVLMKSDGYPAYNFGVVVDDIEMKITHVIRGEEHISNTPRQLALYQALGKEPPKFAHLPTLRNMDRRKLSKRRDQVDLGFFRKAGFLPQALVNFLCLLGWSHPEGKEVFSFDEFARKFDIKRVRRAGPVFDVAKLEWLNGVYIREMKDRDFSKALASYIAADVPGDLLTEVAPLVKERITKLSDASSLLSFFWEEPQVGKGVFSGNSGRHIASALAALAGVDEWNLGSINKVLEKEIKESGYKTGDFYMSLRLALTGSKITPPINESMVALGKDKVLHRLGEAEKALLVQ